MCICMVICSLGHGQVYVRKIKKEVALPASTFCSTWRQTSGTLKMGDEKTDMSFTGERKDLATSRKSLRNSFDDDEKIMGWVIMVPP